MERNGMYENTPWERIAEYGLLVGLGVLVLAIIYYTLCRRLPDARRSYDFSVSGLPAAAAVAIIGAVFTQWWVEAHANYPYPFGRIMLGVGCGVSILALTLAFSRRAYLPAAARLAALLIPVTAAIYVSATSKSIIAEGQVTAMVLPYVWIIALVLVCALAPLIQSVARRLVPELDSASLWLAGVLLFTLIYIINDRLPVVQFRDDGSVFPVMGPSYVAFLGGISVTLLLRYSRSLAEALPWMVGIVLAVIFSYRIGYSYGVAIAATGAALMWTLGTALATRRDTDDMTA